MEPIWLPVSHCSVMGKKLSHTTLVVWMSAHKPGMGAIKWVRAGSSQAWGSVAAVGAVWRQRYAFGIALHEVRARVDLQGSHTHGPFVRERGGSLSSNRCRTVPHRTVQVGQLHRNCKE